MHAWFSRERGCTRGGDEVGRELVKRALSLPLETAAGGIGGNWQRPCRGCSARGAPCGWGGCCSSAATGSRPCCARSRCTTTSSACTAQQRPGGGGGYNSSRMAHVPLQASLSRAPCGGSWRQGSGAAHSREKVISMPTSGWPVEGLSLLYLGAGSEVVKGRVGSKRLVCIAISSPRAIAGSLPQHSAGGGVRGAGGEWGGICERACIRPGALRQHLNATAPPPHHARAPEW